MANPNDPLFTIDAKQILAKLHLAAQSQIKLGWPINSGIIDPVDQGNPKNPGKTTFDLKNTSGEYEMGIARSDFYYQLPIDLTKNKGLAKLEKDLDVKKGQIKGLTDDKAKMRQEEVHEVQLKILEELRQYKLDAKNKVKENAEEVKTSPDKVIAAYKEAIKAENELRDTKKKEMLEKFKKEAFKQIKTYFKWFAGDEASSKIKADEVVPTIIDMDGKTFDSPSKVKDFKDYKIPVVDEKTIQTESEKHQATKPDDFMQNSVCFKVGYTLEVETL